MMKYIFAIFLFFSVRTSAQLPQNYKWTLQQCIDYAIANNISVKQADVQKRIAEINEWQAKGAYVPTLGGNVGLGYNRGLSENPTTGTLEVNDFFSGQISVSSSYSITSWGARKNNIAANTIGISVADAGLEKAKNDISLNVANAFLQAMLNNENINIAKVQLDQSVAQQQNTEKLVNAGSIPDLNNVQMQAQVARDSANYIQAQANYKQSVISLKALLALPQAQQFDIAIPPIELIPVENITELSPEYVYTLGQSNQPLQRINALRIQQAEKSAAAAKAAQYPQVFVQGSLNSRYVGIDYPSGATLVPGFDTSFNFVNVGGTPYPVLSPKYAVEYNKRPLFTQLNDNFGQYLGVGLSFSIFNNRQMRGQYKLAKTQVAQYELQQKQDNINLETDIYNAYEQAKAALEKYNASVRSVEASQKALDYSKKRYDIGMLGILDYIITQNNLLTAKIQEATNRYDYVFKMKVLEFYKGQGLKF